MVGVVSVGRHGGSLRMAGAVMTASGRFFMPSAVLNGA
ncbi:hypothetical protein l13_16490 [Neisseria weaveri ATCC 51223]|nr:hypothetical protein l13_16490 [Neisseria weaveri ATCC 51223]